MSDSPGGLRWDYLTPSWWNMTDMAGDRLKAFDWIQKHGSTMKQVVPVFPPYDLPVWTSMATGLYPKNTGVIGDHMFNLNSRELFSKEDNTADLENWWLQGDISRTLIGQAPTLLPSHWAPIIGPFRAWKPPILMP